jgi:hypothetical protein
MSGGTTDNERWQKPYYRTASDFFLWHQYQGENTNDCAAFSVAIVGNAFLNENRFDGGTIAREMEKIVFVTSPLPHFTLRKIPKYATLPWGVSGYLQSKNIPAKLHWFGNVDDLLRNIQDNRLTIVIIGDLLRGWGHAKVLYGFEPAGPQPEKGFYFVDPGYPKEWSRPQHPQGVFLQGEDEFKREWNNLFRIYIDIGT